MAAKKLSDEAVDALAGVLLDSRPGMAAEEGRGFTVEDIRCAVSAGASWLIEQTGAGVSKPVRVAPAPIGLYFAKLWYFEDLYPVIFAVSALQKVRRLHQVP